MKSLNSNVACCMQHFEGFDPEGYSIWFCEYKYPEENTVNFIVMNKVCFNRTFLHGVVLCVFFGRTAHLRILLQFRSSAGLHVLLDWLFVCFLLSSWLFWPVSKL